MCARVSLSGTFGVTRKTDFSRLSSIYDALDNWSILGEGSLWRDVEIVTAPAAIAAKYVSQDRAAWHYDQFWWWSNSGAGEGQVGLPLKNVARADAIENFRRHLQNPHSRHFPT